MRILIDESLPRHLKQMLPGHETLTVQEMGWTGAKNGDLLKMAGSQFDALLTADKNLRHQQDLQGVNLIIIVLPSNRLKVLQRLAEQLGKAIRDARAGDVLEL